MRSRGLTIVVSLLLTAGIVSAVASVKFVLLTAPGTISGLAAVKVCGIDIYDGVTPLIPSGTTTPNLSVSSGLSSAITDSDSGTCVEFTSPATDSMIILTLPNARTVTAVQVQGERLEFYKLILLDTTGRALVKNSIGGGTGAQLFNLANGDSMDGLGSIGSFHMSSTGTTSLAVARAVCDSIGSDIAADDSASTHSAFGTIMAGVVTTAWIDLQLTGSMWRWTSSGVAVYNDTSLTCLRPPCYFPLEGPQGSGSDVYIAKGVGDVWTRGTSAQAFFCTCGKTTRWTEYAQVPTSINEAGTSPKIFTFPANAHIVVDGVVFPGYPAQVVLVINTTKMIEGMNTNCARQGVGSTLIIRNCMFKERTELWIVGTTGTERIVLDGANVAGNTLSITPQLKVEIYNNTFINSHLIFHSIQTVVNAGERNGSRTAEAIHISVWNNTFLHDNNTLRAIQGGGNNGMYWSNALAPSIRASFANTLTSMSMENVSLGLQHGLFNYSRNRIDINVSGELRPLAFLGTIDAHTFVFRHNSLEARNRNTVALSVFYLYEVELRILRLLSIDANHFVLFGGPVNVLLLMGNTLSIAMGTYSVSGDFALSNNNISATVGSGNSAIISCFTASVATSLMVANGSTFKVDSNNVTIANHPDHISPTVGLMLLGNNRPIRTQDNGSVFSISNNLFHSPLRTATLVLFVLFNALNIERGGTARIDRNTISANSSTTMRFLRVGNQLNILRDASLQTQHNIVRFQEGANRNSFFATVDSAVRVQERSNWTIINNTFVSASFSSDPGQEVEGLYFGQTVLVSDYSLFYMAQNDWNITSQSGSCLAKFVNMGATTISDNSWFWIEGNTFQGKVVNSGHMYALYVRAPTRLAAYPTIWFLDTNTWD